MLRSLHLAIMKRCIFIYLWLKKNVHSIFLKLSIIILDNKILKISGNIYFTSNEFLSGKESEEISKHLVLNTYQFRIDSC